jgi:hypothetical protein
MSEELLISSLNKLCFKTVRFYRNVKEGRVRGSGRAPQQKCLTVELSSDLNCMASRSAIICFNCVPLGDTDSRIFEIRVLANDEVDTLRKQFATKKKVD